MSAITEWLDDRIGLGAIRKAAAHKTVPLHRHTVFYYLGGMTLFFFMIQVCTGVLLMLYYRPSAEEAFESVELIMTTVPFGWLIRSIHSWSANLMVFFAFIHMASVFFLKAYRAPRELTWVTGVLLFFLILGFGFSGYLLPWNMLAFFATKVGTDVAGVVPIAGEWVLRFLRGGDRVTSATLSRFYGWHVAVLPAITLVVLGAHLALVQIKGMSIPPKQEDEARRRPPMPFLPHFALRDLTGWVFALGVLAALAALFPWELGDKADLFAPAYEDIRPEWYFVFMFQTLKLVPGGEILGIEYEAIPILLFSLGGLVLLLVPFLDRNASRDGRSPMWTLGGVLSIAFMIAMTCWGYASLVPLYAVVATLILLAVLALITRGPRQIVALLALGFVLGIAAPTRAAEPVATTRVAPPTPTAPSAQATPPTLKTTSCTACHGGEAFDDAARAKVRSFAADVHAQVGLSCHDCHGGNPDPKLADDPSAMDPAMGYIGAPQRQDIPSFCGRCHASADYMKRFNPAARVDQVAEYHTSMHGQLLAKGDTNVATCVDCHSVHDIRRHGSPESPVYPTRVAETCSRCHSDAKRMASYQIPVDQYARWKVSVHANALLGKGDLSAPTCNDCHGNHGAVPPGVESVSFVCGNCHGREAELFRKSRKHELWQQHNEMAAGAPCETCHDDTRATLKLTRFTECVTCHENHSVVRPTVALVGDMPDTPCAFCHDGSGPLAQRVAEPEKKAAHFQQVRARLINEANAKGIPREQRFDWLVDRALELETHRVDSGGKPKLRPEFSRLFEKFRIGKTHYAFTDPATGKQVLRAVRQCRDCHGEETSSGRVSSRAYLDATRSLTSMIARAERILLSAHRGGVEVRQVRAELDGAVDSQIELQTYVHTFSPTDVQTKQKEGLKHAEAALLAGQSSLEELTYRRKGLLGALGAILLVLVALMLKIRTL